LIDAEANGISRDFKGSEPLIPSIKGSDPLKSLDSVDGVATAH